ncbi:MAG: hypothetical protein JXA21_08560 [Anaerolineae bacterium]|nr:hypothetical protein [Anaerolineae bacterium]
MSNPDGEAPDYTRGVSVEDSAAEDWTLNISRYVLPPIGEDTPRRRRKLSPISKPPCPACARPKRGSGR